MPDRERPLQAERAQRGRAEACSQGHCGLLWWLEEPVYARCAQKAMRMDKFAAERVVEDIVYLGHARVMLRSDNEPALLLHVGDALQGLRIQQFDSAAAEG